MGSLLVLAVLMAAAVVVFREANHTTEVEAAPGYSLPEATAFVIGRLPDPSLRRLRRSEVERLVAYCLGLLERAGLALDTRRPQGDELEGAELVLEVHGLETAMRDETAVLVADEDRAEIARAFMEYLVAIGAVGEEALGERPAE